MQNYAHQKGDYFNFISSLAKFLGGSEAMRLKGKAKCFAGAEDNSRDNL